MEEEEKGKINMEKIKILAILPNNQELQGGIYTVKIYSSDREGEDWLYSGLEGLLALIIDNSVKTKYICMYDPTNYQKVFQYEMYKNFEKYFEELAPDFRSFEIESGFIGLQFESPEDAVNFERVVKRIATMKNELFNKAQVKEDHKLQKEIAQNYAKLLKENFTEKDNKYDEKYAEDGTQICKHRNFKVLNNISYDKAKKVFKFGKISDELKEMFLSCGIKKKDLEKDMDFAFTLFKKVIVGLGTENKLKNSALDSIQHNFLPPSEREKLLRQEEAAEAKMHTKKKTIKKKVPKSKPRPLRPMAGKRASVPLAPPPPPPPPPPPSVPSAVPNKRASAAINVLKPTPKPEVDVQTQLQNIKLKKVTKEENKDKNLGGTGKNFLQNALSAAIKNRRQNLHMHDDDNDDEEEDDWD
jgi:Wiskott-Aldrich syndrome protein